MFAYILNLSLFNQSSLTFSKWLSKSTISEYIPFLAISLDFSIAPSSTMKTLLVLYILKMIKIKYIHIYFCLLLNTILNPDYINIIYMNNVYLINHYNNNNI